MIVYLHFLINIGLESAEFKMAAKLISLNQSLFDEYLGRLASGPHDILRSFC
jgi:hypothetical protein